MARRIVTARVHEDVFQPDKIPGYFMWWDAGDLPVQENGAVIGTWTDRSENVLVATQSTNKITYLNNAANGHPAVVANGDANAWMDVARLKTIAATNMTFTAALDITALAEDNFQQLMKWRTDDDDQLGLLIDSNGNGGGLFYAGGAHIGTNAISAGKQILTWHCEGTGGGSFTFHRNGTQLSTTGNMATQADHQTGATFRLFSNHAGTQRAFCNLYEIVGYTSALSSANQALLEGYMSTKYGIALD